MTTTLLKITLAGIALLTIEQHAADYLHAQATRITQDINTQCQCQMAGNPGQP